MKIAMLTYSVKPRGGVVHALEVSEALARRGHRVELMALADRGLVTLHTKEYKLSQANDALHDLHHGRIHGRAVLIP